MKKLVYALAALSMVALMGLTSCQKNKLEDPLDEFVEMGRYIGMTDTTVKADLVEKGWTDVSTSTQTLYSKQIDGKDAMFEMHANEGGLCIDVTAGIIGNYYEDAKSLLNKVGASYTFSAVNITAGFVSVLGQKPDTTWEIQPDFLGAQGCVVNNSYVDFSATWTGNSGATNYNVIINTVSASNGCSITFEATTN